MLTLFLVLSLALIVASGFAAVSTRKMFPMVAYTWDGRLLTPNQVFNRESLRRVVGYLAGGFDKIRRSTRLEWKRWLKMALIGLTAFAIGYVVALVVHVVILGVLWVVS